MGRRSIILRDSTSQYLVEIGRIPLLTADQEVELAQKIQRWMGYKEHTGDSLPDDWELVKRQGKRALDKMMQSNLRLVVKVAKKFAQHRNTMDLMDLVQEGSIGLRRAAEKFDPTQGYKFSTYAYWWIQQSIIRSLYEQDNAVRLPPHIGEKDNRIRKAIHAIKQRGERVCDEAIAAETGLSLASIETVHRAKFAQPVSLNVKVGEDQETERLELISAGGEDLLDALAEREYWEQRRDRLQRAMAAALNQQERDVLHLRCLTDEPKTTRICGEMLGMSRTSVGAIESRAKRKLKYHLAPPRERKNPTPQIPTYLTQQSQIKGTILQLLIESNKVLSKRQICESLGKLLYGIDPKSSVLRQSVGAAIVRLKEQGHPIISIYGKGYRYGAENVIKCLPPSLAEIVDRLQGCHNFETGKTIVEVAGEIDSRGNTIPVHRDNIRTKFSHLKRKLGDRLQRGRSDGSQEYRYWLQK